MRDLLIVAIFAWLTPAALKRPYVGALLWAWISVMNPHRLAYGFAFDLQLGLAAAALTLLSMLMHRDQVRSIPKLPVVKIWGAFCLWMVVTTIVALYPEDSQEMLGKVAKIMFMLFMTIIVVVEKRQIQLLIWVYAMSIGLLGVKSGLYTLSGGGGGRVWGPPGSFIYGNNEIGLAFVVSIPILYYLTFQTQNRWLKLFTFGCAAASALATFGTQSRGAFLAIGSMAAFLWLKSDRKLPLGILLVFAGFAILAFMPDSWHNRMDTIKTYDQDASAMGRINAWWMAFNLATDHWLGGGFAIYKGSLFARYAPNPEDIHAAHSIYFQVLGEHGFIGLALYLLFGVFSWRLASTVHKRANGNPDLDWITRFALMAKVSIIGFAVGGAFLSLAYFDLPYYLTVTLLAMYRWLDLHQASVVPARGRAMPAMRVRRKLPQPGGGR
ncbi:MAG: putative O-glycosylation ligase, exosortase A system-associated [Chitinivorax sp.]